jgi:hypothetical protein
VTPSPALIIRESSGQAFYEAKFRHDRRQVKRRLGPAWLVRVGDTWRPRGGRVGDGYLDERRAHVAAAQIVDDYLREAADRTRAEAERQAEPVTFREVARDYLRWLATVRGAKPSTLRDRESVLAEPGAPYRRGAKTLNGYVMGALGNRPAMR